MDFEHGYLLSDLRLVIKQKARLNSRSESRRARIGRALWHGRQVAREPTLHSPGAQAVPYRVTDTRGKNIQLFYYPHVHL